MSDDAALTLDGVTGGYGRSTVLRDVSLNVARGAVVALLGPNGAGKTTLLRTAAGLLPVQGGRVEIGGADLTSRPAHRRARAGLCLIPEGRGVFPQLSVRENLRLQVPPWSPDKGYDAALDMFPALGDKLDQPAGRMSGGQQQMLALSRCLLAEPAVVLLDEVSMGLAPRVVDEIFDALRSIAARGTALLVVEQYVGRALSLADHVYLLDRGSIGFSGSPDALDEAELMRRYAGATAVAETPPHPVSRSTSSEGEVL